MANRLIEKAKKHGGNALGAVKGLGSLSGKTKVNVATGLLALTLGGGAIKSGYEGYVSNPATKAESALLLSQDSDQQIINNGDSIYNILSEEDRQDIIDVCQEYDIPKHLYVSEDGSYFISNENIYSIKDYLVTEYTTEQGEAKDLLWKLLLAIGVGSLVLARIRRQHEAQDKAIDQMNIDSANEDIQYQIAQIKNYLNSTLPKEAGSIDMLFEMASYPDLGAAREQLEKDYLEAIKKSENAISTIETNAKSIHDIVSGLMGYNYDTKQPDINGSGIIREQLSKLSSQYNIAQSNINPGLTGQLHNLAGDEKVLAENRAKLVALKPTEGQQIKKDNVDTLLANSSEIRNLTKIIKDQESTLEQDFEEIRKNIGTWYNEYSSNNQIKLQELQKDKTLGEETHTLNKAKILELMKLGKDRSENKDEIVSSVFPKIADEVQIQAQEKFSKYEEISDSLSQKEEELANLESTRSNTTIEGDTGTSVDNIIAQLSDETNTMLESGMTIHKCNKKLLQRLEKLAINTTFEIENEEGVKETKKLSEYIIVDPNDKSISGSSELTQHLDLEILDSHGKMVSIGAILSKLIDLNQECLLVKQLGRQWKYEDRVQEESDKNSEEYSSAHKSLTDEIESLKATKDQLEVEIKEHAHQSSAVDFDNHKRDVLSQALTNTIEALAGDGQQHTADEIYERFFQETIKLDPAFVEKRYGIKQLNNQKTIDPSIIRKFLFDSGITGANTSMVYHTMRALLASAIPAASLIIGDQVAKSLTGGDGIFDPQNIPVLLSSIGLGYFAHLYIKEYNTRMARIQEYQMSGTISVKEVFWDRMPKAMYACMATYCLLLGLDIVGAASTMASTAIKETNAKVTAAAYDKLAGSTNTFNTFVVQSAEANEQGAVKTITDEVEDGGAGPLTADKFNLTHQKGSNEYSNMLTDILLPKKVNGFDEALASETPGVSNLESINDSLNLRMDETKKLMLIVRDGKQISWDQIPQYMKSLGSDLDDVNTANQVDDVKQQFKQSAKSVVIKLKLDLERYAQETNKLNYEYKQVGGQPISIQPIDSTITAQQIETITKAVDEFAKSLDDSNTFIKFSVDGISDIVHTIYELPTGKMLFGVGWMSIISILALWLAAFKFRQTKQILNKKSEDSEDIGLVINNSRKEFESIIGESVPNFDSKTLTTIADERWIKHALSADKVAIDQEMGSFVYTSDLDSNPTSIPLIKQLFGDSLREDYQTHNSSYTDWVIDHNVYNDDQLWLIIMDLFTHSPTFRQELIEEIVAKTPKIVTGSNSNTAPVMEATAETVEATAETVEATAETVEATAETVEEDEIDESIRKRRRSKSAKFAKNAWNKRPRLFN